MVFFYQKGTTETEDLCQYFQKFVCVVVLNTADSMDKITINTILK